MEHLEREMKYVEHWNSYGELLGNILAPDIAGICTVCVIVGKLVTNFSNMTKFFNVPYVMIQLDIGQPNSTASSLLAGIEAGCNSFLVHHHAILDFLDVYREIHDKAGYRNPEKYLVFLMEDRSTDSLLELIRGHPSMQEIINLLIFQPGYDRLSVDLLTHRFIDSRQDIEWYRVDRYKIEERSFEKGNRLFPDKTFNLMGKSIRVATFNINPHIFLIEEAEIEAPFIRWGGQPYSLNGPNGILLMEFCLRRNCTIDLVVDSVNMWGAINPNRSGNGILGNVVERRADLGIGALSSWYHCYQFLAFSFAYERGGVSCVVPKPKQLPRWKEIAMGFTTSAYLTIFVTFCCTVVVYMLIVRFSIQGPLERTIAWNALNVLAIYLLQATNIVRSRSVSETLLSMAVLIFSMNIAAIYLGKYASLRTIPMYEPAIDSKEDLAKSGLPWMQAHEAWSYSLRLSDNPTEVNLRSTFEVHPPPVLSQIANQGNSAFALARLHNGHLMLGDWINAGNIHKYQLMRHDLYYEHEVAMATKTWPLMERFNELLGRATEASLLLVQEYQNIFHYNDYYVQMVALNSHVREPNKPKALAVEDVLGGLIILGSGLVCASVVFLVEIWLLCPRKTVLLRSDTE